ncbi:MAG: HlyD family secretion protein [Candidatus Promineifilaceae bacterium]|jgi:HlyD family secretion protein
MSIKTIFRTILISTLALLLLGCAGRGLPAEDVETDVETESDTAETSVVDATETEAEPEVLEPVEQPRLTILADGQIRNGRPALPLAFETTGKLLSVNVQVGEEVTEGDVIATLDDQSLQDAVSSAQLRVTSAQNSLLQSQGELQKLLTWEPDASTVAIAEANITSAETSLKNAETQDAAAGSNLTSVNIQIQQAQREVVNAQEAYDNAFSEGREWETEYHGKVCENINGVEQCSSITWAERIKQDREGSTARLQNAKDQLQISRANWSVQAAQASGNSAVNVEAQVVGAREELNRALKGPTEAEIAAAELNIAQSTLTLEQEQFSLTQAQNALDQAQILAPWDGTIQSVDVSPGGMVGVGSPIVTLIDMTGLEFVTTNLSERDLDQIMIGQEARITLKTYPNDPISGTVSRIDLAANGTVGDAAIFPVIIQFETGDLVVRQGMTGRVEILHDN